MYARVRVHDRTPAILREAVSHSLPPYISPPPHDNEVKLGMYYCRDAATSSPSLFGEPQPDNSSLNLLPTMHCLVLSALASVMMQVT